MATAIEVRYCRRCGQLESMRSTVDGINGQVIIEVGCSCGASPVRRTVLGLQDAYYLDVEVRQEGAKTDEHTGSGDVPQG
ncbi:MAG: hypothetical protein PUH70_12040 [Clostridiales bacterium]|nr:hypothetical protein [Clostridiales bacterium]MDY5514800.1 hypothetical protein [Candidatus Ventricola sp.]